MGWIYRVVIWLEYDFYRYENRHKWCTLHTHTSNIPYSVYLHTWKYVVCIYALCSVVCTNIDMRNENVIKMLVLCCGKTRTHTVTETETHTHTNLTRHDTTCTIKAMHAILFLIRPEERRWRRTQVDVHVCIAINFLKWKFFQAPSVVQIHFIERTYV